MEKHKVIIIGSGPAGYTAALYAGRASLDVTVLAGPQPGGQLTTTSVVENFPGFPDGINGPDLMINMQKQAEKFGAKLLYENAVDIDIEKRPFVVTTDSGKHEVDAIIIASGASAKYLGLPDEQKYVGRGYHTCATCDGFFYRGKNVVVVGGGDSAMEESHYLAKLANSVTIIHRRGEFRASKIMQKRVLEDPKIKVIWNSAVTKFSGDKRLEKIEIQDVNTGEKQEMTIDGLFVAIGYNPNSGFVKGKLDMNEAGYLHAKEKTMSHIPGIFIAGDIEDYIYRQAVTAAADGCKAAMDCEKWLATQ
ncbi:MAG: thioredoxin-disulfide reductase [Candidatus Abawacabacteria bacterium RBG_16_42_10]|uniref:Thioredoxin reductase n=1 Tax=Candidatus Abawacabacteria bacterium RBG_16_42_10 TaxID=1817814 RepID=A0A1F4XNB8_9BACT|nr:MAG: thioredoxin-disulfide reductase [Candidatus Abawacabacteria bacterium RBG_16_42_10]